MTPLRLADDALILADDEMLRVFSRRGVFRAQGRHLDRLHATILPYLQGRDDEHELGSSLPDSQAEVLRRYLSFLRGAGALRSELSGEALDPILTASLSRLGPDAPRLDFPLRDRTVHVSLDGLYPDICEAPHGSTRLCFVRPEIVQPLLLNVKEHPENVGLLTLVVPDLPGVEPPGHLELVRRAAYARWLLPAALEGLRGGQGIQVYRLESEASSLRRLVFIGQSSPAGHTVPEQLGLIQRADVAQVPLVVATASHPLFTPIVACVGLTYAAVRARLLVAFIAEALSQDHRDETEDDRGALRVSAPSRLCLHAELLDRMAGRRMLLGSRMRWKAVNLLQEPREHAAVAYLQDILRVRRSQVPGRVATNSEGLYLYRAEELHASSYLRTKALAEILLLMVWREFYSSGTLKRAGLPAPLAGWSMTDFATAAALQKIVEACHREGRLVVRELRCWGTSVWVGHPVSSSP